MSEYILYKDKAKTPDERAADLLSRMTLDEKIGQLVQIEGFFTYEKCDGKIKIKKEYADQIAAGKIGALWAFFRADWWTGKNFDNGITPDICAQAANEIQRIAMQSRLGIPLFIAEECAHGLMALGSTVFPTGLGQASTFNPELIKKMGQVVGDETRAIGAHIAYGPVLDVARDPRWSRVEEGYGEDPCVISEMGKAYVKGLQGDSFDGGRVISTLKHFAAHGEPEGGHNSAAAHVGECDLLNYHLRGFKSGVKAGALSVMSSYNHIDGVPCTSSRKLLTKILREDWGFDGFVVSDAGAIPSLRIAHRVASDDAECAALALKAGVDMDLCGNVYAQRCKEALDRGLITAQDIDKAVMRILRLKFMMGLFENPYIDQETATKIIGCCSNREVALEVARESMILLENNGMLPLKGIKSLAVIGPNADTPMNQLGDYTAPQKAGSIVTVYQGIRRLVGDKIKINYAKGCKVRSLDRSMLDEAIKAAIESDAVVLVLGGSSSPDANTGFLENGAARVTEIMRDSEFDKDSGEGYDRAYLDLAGLQIELLQSIKKLGKPVAVVLIQGRPLIIDKVKEYADAVVLAWYPGCEGGTAVAEVLFGKYNPAGRLPITIPRFEGQLPVYYNTTRTGGNYIDLPASPLYEFGYGLSFTRFEYSNILVSPARIKIGETATASVYVKNVGEMDGDEVVQMYIFDRFASIVRPFKELKGFKRVHIKAGEMVKVEFKIGFDELAFYNEELKYVVEPGEFDIMIGGNLSNTLSCTLTAYK